MWLTEDGVAVLDHDGRLPARGVRRLRRTPISSTARAALPGHVPSLHDLYEQCGNRFELSLDAKDPAAAAIAAAVAREAGDGAVGRLWLCHPDWELLARWRTDPAFEGVRLVNTTRRDDMRRGPERRAAQLNDAGIDALNVHNTDCTAGLAALFHRFGRYVFGWDAQHDRVIRALVHMGIDGIYGDHVDRLVDAIGLCPGPDAEHG